MRTGIKSSVKGTFFDLKHSPEMFSGFTVPFSLSFLLDLLTRKSSRQAVTEQKEQSVQEQELLFQFTQQSRSGKKMKFLAKSCNLAKTVFCWKIPNQQANHCNHLKLVQQDFNLISINTQCSIHAVLRQKLRLYAQNLT